MLSRIKRTVRDKYLILVISLFLHETSKKDRPTDDGKKTEQQKIKRKKTEGINERANESRKTVGRRDQKKKKIER